MWRSRGALVAALVGVCGVGVLIGRVTSREQPATAPAEQHSAAAAPTAEPQVFYLTDDPRAHGGVPLRPMDREIFDLITTLKLERKQMSDVFPDRPYRVAFVGSIAEHHVGLVAIDMNRDNNVDERWDLKKRGEVNRVVLHDPAAGGNQVQYSLAHGRWQPH
jgi:hypothetical protein